MPGTFDGRLAFASVLFAAPGAPAFRTQSGDFASVAVVGGVTRLTFQGPIAPYQGFPSLTLRSATGGYASVVDWTSTYLDVETLDTTGAAAEIEFDLTIVQQTVSFVVPPAPPPSPPLSQLSAWYRAGDVIQPNGSPVTTWADLSGNGADLGVIAPFGQPTLVVADPDFGGQNSLDLDGTQQLYRSLPPGYQGGDSALSLYIVAKPTAGSTRVAFGWGMFFPGDSVNANWSVNGPQTVVELTDGASMGSKQFVTTNDAQIFSAFLGQGENILTQSEVLVDGVIPPDLGGGAPGTLSLQIPVPQVRLGSYFGTPATSYVGRIAEILVYSKKHTPAERAQTLAYLSARYGIPVP